MRGKPAGVYPYSIPYKTLIETTIAFDRVELAKRIPWLAINEQEPSKDNVSTTTEATSAATPAE